MSVFELRQYTLKPGRTDDLVDVLWETVGELNTSTTFSGILSNAGDLSGLNLIKAGTGGAALGEPVSVPARMDAVSETVSCGG